MTKILYIPTSEFITFVLAEKNYNEIYSEIIERTYHSEVEEAIKHILDMKQNTEFASRNKLKFPVLKEELEIVYD